MTGSRGVLWVAVVLLSLSTAGVAAGTETKHSAMAGSQLIPTHAELNAFAWKAIDAGTFIEVTSGVDRYDDATVPRATDGQAQMVIQITEDLALQFQSNKGAFGTRVASYAWYGTATRSPFSIRTREFGSVDLQDYLGKPSSYSAISDGQRFDVDLAGRMGDGGWSVGLSQAGAGTVDDKANTEDSDGLLALRASLGFGGNINLAGEFGYEKATRKSGSNKLEGSTILLTGLGTVDVSGWVMRGALHFEGGSHEEFDGSKVQDLDHAMYALLAGVGRLLADDEDGQVSVEGYIDLSANAQDQGEKAKTGYASVALPGMRVGFWHKIGGGFKVMGGVAADYRGKAVVKDDTNGDRSEEKGIAELDFHWTLGTSVNLAERVDIDVQVHPEAIPHLLSLGNTDPVIMIASVNVAI